MSIFYPCIILVVLDLCADGLGSRICLNFAYYLQDIQCK